jgi:hypothetical protein
MVVLLAIHLNQRKSKLIHGAISVLSIVLILVDSSRTSAFRLPMQ